MDKVINILILPQYTIKDNKSDILICQIRYTNLYCYGTETNVQSSQWKQLNKQKLKNIQPIQSNITILLAVLVNYYTILFHEFLPDVQ